MNALPKVLSIIRLSEQVINADTVWMLVAERRIRHYLNVSKDTPDEPQSIPTLHNMEAYFDQAGPAPKYAADPLAAEQYYDSSVLWFLSTYSIALAQMDFVNPFPDSALRVIERLRARASASFSANMAA